MFTARVLAASLLLALGVSPARAEDPLTTPGSPLYQPDPETRAQAKAAVDQNRLPATVPEEVEALPPARRPPPEARSLVSRDNVMVAQRRLRARGYDPGPIDGAFGQLTRRALQAFQISQGLPADGILTAAMVDRLVTTPTVATALPAVEPPPPPPAPVAISWSLAHTVGKTAHALPGDMLGRVADFVMSPENEVAGMIIATENGYGTNRGTAQVPFAKVGPSIAWPTVILPLNAPEALPLRDKKQKVELAPGQWLLTSATTARKGGETLGSIRDVIADSDGKLLELKIQRDDDSVVTVPAAGVELIR
ncbi:MAG TPA: peptidoglycan-binding domain-containing protein [Magnetospirillum sp.]|jgi:peptidoglycan hydrolase-like protein with peptidoglycan-binding domain|nr:peptidoglycan-binding domain-containing protein [Magnetospirillum sp.]